MDTTENDNTLIGDINMTLHGDPVLVDGVLGKALSFNGVDQYAEIIQHTYVLNVSVSFLNGLYTLYFVKEIKFLDHVNSKKRNYHYKYLPCFYPTFEFLRLKFLFNSSN